MRKLLISSDAFADLNEGFLFYESQEFGMGDYFVSCLREDIEGLKVTAETHRKIQGFYRLLSRRFPYGVYYTITEDKTTIWAVIDLRRDPKWIMSKLKNSDA